MQSRAATHSMALALVMAACVACSASSAPVQQQGDGGGAAIRASAPIALAPADAQTGRIVDAATVFVAGLDPAQRQRLFFAFGDRAQRARWSNLPVGAVARAGIAWGELNATQKEALMALLGAVLSEQGIAMVHEQMDADDVLRGPRGDAGGGTGGLFGGFGRGGGGNFGSDRYYVSILGTPSRTAPWMLQFGGHHLAINASIVGARVSLSPSLTGGQPLRYMKDGREVWIVENEVNQSQAMLASLTPAQREQAVISTERIGLVLGPGHDGQVLQPEGLPGSAMTAAQKARFLALIEARLDILNADDLAATMAPIRRTLDQTYFAWWGPTAPLGAAYFRVTGPALQIEFSPQGGRDATDHAHNMYREPGNEYGSGWTGLE